MIWCVVKKQPSEAIDTMGQYINMLSGNRISMGNFHDRRGCPKHS